MDSPLLSVSSAISHHRAYLRTVYKNSPILSDNKWPPTPSKEYIYLAMIEGDRCREDYIIGHTLQGNIKQVLKNRKEICIEEILEDNGQNQSPRLVLIEGPPGSGKSTLAWELCRKWEDFSCMKQYNLVVLLRLREKEVHSITDVSDLFYSCKSEVKKSLVGEVSECQGKGVLFLLDGFDELPNELQRNGYLVELIKGSVLPKSTVVVTSRPSATAKLLISCKPQKHIEILGFTQKSVEAYASSVFQSEPDVLKKFKAYISASSNPAINSLMYIPLNAAIIVQIYRNCKSESFLPHTLTELYTELCLTILNRFLELQYPSVRVQGFKDLPDDLHKQFLKLSEVAYEGVQKGELIFHTVPPGLVHFSFLDAVPALYGGGRVSYNFLHFTVQEFFAAYYITSLGSGGLEVFKQSGNDEQWNVVWRFVAGLTKFEHLEGHIDPAMFTQENNSISQFIIQCLFEAQSIKYFESYFKAFPPPRNLCYSFALTPLDAYACGYCIANYLTGFSFSLKLIDWVSPLFFQFFKYGMKTKVNGVGYIEELTVCNYDLSSHLGVLKYCSLRKLTSLCLTQCFLNNSDMIELSHLILRMTSLKQLNISHNRLHNNGLEKVLQSLSNNNINLTTLDITDTGFCRSPSRSLLIALKRLINPSSGKLKELVIGENSVPTFNRPLSRNSIIIKQYFEFIEKLKDLFTKDNSRLVDILCGESSLHSLSFHSPTQLSLYRLANYRTTCLTTLSLKCDRMLVSVTDFSIAVLKILSNNRTLKYLAISSFYLPEEQNALQPIVLSLRQNTTLKKLEVSVFLEGLKPDSSVSKLIRKKYKKLSHDSRILWKSYTTYTSPRLVCGSCAFIQ